jgi:uncharacterized membrane-anchored protein YitT (DUF2179 family)
VKTERIIRIVVLTVGLTLMALQIWMTFWPHDRVFEGGAEGARIYR